MANINIEDFSKADIRAGTVIAVETFPEACKPAWKLKIDLGKEIGIKNSSAQVTDLYTDKQLIGSQVMCVVNLPSRRIGPFRSEVLTLGLQDENGSVVVLAPERAVPNGAKVF